MTRDEVISLLAYIKRKKPNCFKAEQSAEIVNEWCSRLRNYEKSEVKELFACGGFIRIPYYNYQTKHLDDLIQGLDELRWEKTPEGIKKKEEMVNEYARRHGKDLSQ